MANYQNYRGSVFFDRTGSARRLENTSLNVPGATASASLAVWFRITAQAEAPETTTVEHIIRVGAATTNTPTIGIRYTPSSGQLTARIETSSQQTIGTFTPSLNTNYCLVWVWTTATLNTTDHPDAASGDYAICYLYEMSTRTPSASFSTSNNGALSTTLNGGVDSTGIDIRSQSGRTSFAVSDMAMWFGTVLTKAQCDQLGQRTRDPRQIGTTPTHYWKTAYRTGTAGSLTTISASPAGSELHHLADLGSGTARDLTANGGSGERPEWLATSLRQDVTSTEDERLDTAILNAIPASLNLSGIKTAIANGAAGTIVGLAHDSFGRPNLTARDGGHEAAGWVEYGYTVMGTTSYLNDGLAGGSSLRTGVALVAGSSDTTLSYLCNGPNGGFATEPASGAQRFGLPIGGLAGVVFGASPTFNGITFRVRSACGDASASSDRNWFSTSDKIGVLPVMLRYADTGAIPDRFAGTFRFTTAAEPSGVDWDLTDLSSYRRNPRTYSGGAAAAWADIEAGLGGISASLTDTLVAFKDYIVCGTGNSSYDITVTCPVGTLANTRFYLTLLAFKLDANDQPIVGTNNVFVMHLGDDSLDLNGDLTTSQLPTSDGEKHFTTDQLADWLAIVAPRRATNVALWLDVATENGNTANTITRVRSWMGTTDNSAPRLVYAYKTSNASSGSVHVGLIDQFTHRVGTSDTAANQANQIIEVANAYHACSVNADELNTSDSCAFFSYGNMGKRYWGIPVASETDWTQMGMSEVMQAEQDSAVTTAIGTAEWMNADRLHLGDATAARNYAWARIAAIDAAPIITTTGGGVGLRGLRGLRVRSDTR